MLVEVYQDIACPWCRIGKQNLKLALERWQGEPVEVVYRAFFLNPRIPAGGEDFRPYMLAKGGGQMALEDFFDAPRRMGSQVGVNFNFEAIERASNTEMAHRLVALAPDENKEAVLDALYTAYFEDGRDVGDLETLVKIGEAQGLEGEWVRAQLQGDAGCQQVRAEARQAHLLGIQAVPFYVINQRYGLSGAQPVDAILEVLYEATFENLPSDE